MQEEIRATIGEQMTALDSEKSELNKEALIQIFRNKLEGIK